MYGQHHIDNLTVIKDWGRLKKPSNDLVSICKTAKKVFRTYSKNESRIKSPI